MDCPAVSFETRHVSRRFKLKHAPLLRRKLTAMLWGCPIIYTLQLETFRFLSDISTVAAINFTNPVNNRYVRDLPAG